jgi:putative ABC transport system permease protein
MNRLRLLAWRLRALFRRQRFEADMAAELQAHLEMQAAATRAAGMDADEAHYAARRQFGGVDQIKEMARDQRGWEWLESWGKDFSYASRSLARSPGFTLVVVLTLAFGVAVNSSIFGLFGSLFLRKLPVPDAGRLALVLERVPGESMLGNLSFPDFKDYRARATSFSSLIAYNFEAAHLSSEGGSPERALVQLVTPDAFAALGVPTALGRTLLPADGEDKGGRAVVVLTHRYWQNHFGGDPGVVGRTILINGRPFEVVGVAREGFDGFSLMLQMSAFVPSGAAAGLYANGVRQLEERGFAPWYVLGRLRPGATLAGASAEVQVIGRHLAQEYPESHRHAGATIIALPESRARPDPAIADFTLVFAALFLGLVALVLLIACANVANLMLARTLARQPEFTLRAALGAGRWRLARLVVAESLLLAAVAGAAGWALSSWTGSLVMHYAFAFDAGFPLDTEYRPEPRDLLFAAALSLSAALISSLVPALRSSRVDLAGGLKGAAGGHVTADPHRFRDLLVVGQVVFSLVVLVGAGLFLQSLRRVRALPLGFRSDHLLMLNYDLGLQGYSDQRGQEFCRQLLEKVRTLPGVDAAGLTQHVPFFYSSWARDIWPENPPARLKDGNVLAFYDRVDPGFAAMFGLRLVRGRPLRDTDTASAPRVAVINQALADVCWPGENPIGKRLRWKTRDGPWIEVVGVTETGKYQMISEEPRPYLYLPLQQDYSAPLALMVRSRSDPLALANDLRAAVRALDPHLPVYLVQTMDHLLENSYLARMPMRLGATLSALQGVIGLGLAVMGLYAVVAHGVSRRTREIGIRMALGANARDVVRAVVRDGMRLTLVGLAVGLVLAAALGVALSKVLYAVSALDPGVIAGGTLLLLATTGFACWLPARRAAKVDPVIALRAE